MTIYALNVPNKAATHAKTSNNTIKELKLKQKEAHSKYSHSINQILLKTKTNNNSYILHKIIQNIIINSQAIFPQVT